MSEKHFIIQDGQPKGQRVVITTDNKTIAEEFLDSAKLADLPVKKFTVITNDDLDKKKK